MKKLLFSIFLIFISNFANADGPEVKIINGIRDKVVIVWPALDYAESFLTNEEIRADMLFFFIEHQNEALSTQEVIDYCLSIDSKVACANFIKQYMNAAFYAYPADYNSGDYGNADACAEAASFVGITTNTLYGDYPYEFKTFQEALNYCEVHGHKREYDERYYTSNSIVGACERFLENVRKCTSHLETYYEQELSNKLPKKTAQQYRCILNLVKTGQMNLPVSLMEESCKPTK